MLYIGFLVRENATRAFSSVYAVAFYVFGKTYFVL